MAADQPSVAATEPIVDTEKTTRAAGRPRHGLITRVAVGLALGALIFALGAWAGRATLTPVSPVSAESSARVAVAVTEQTIGQVLHLNATVTRAQTPLGVNSLPGIVTRVGRSGSATAGSCPYWVAAVPVCVLPGTTPMYRTLALGATGADVADLRAGLHTLGYLRATGGSTFDAATADAVKAWQRKLGTDATGQLALGTLLFVDKLPITLSFNPDLRRGARLSGGEALVLQSSSEPSFSLDLGPDQASLVPADSHLTIHSNNTSWPAVITASRTLDSGGTSLTLTAPGGGVVCRTECDRIAAGPSSFLAADVAVVPPTTGPVVPVSAIVTEPDGQQVVSVVAPDGSLQRTVVTTLASDNGLAVVRGVQVGQQVIAVPDPTLVGAAPASHATPTSSMPSTGNTASSTQPAATRS